MKKSKIEKEDTGKIEGVENGTGEKEKNVFDSKYDQLGMVSYKSKIRDHCCEELSFIAGVLDLLYLVDGADQWQERSEEIAFVIMDARDRARGLCDIF